MSVRDLEKIDVIAVHPSGQSVLLVIVDDLDWSDPDSHELLLQEKVNTYLEYVESGQIMEDAPSLANGGRVEIRLALGRPTTARARGFLARLRDALEAAGYAWSVEEHGGDPAC